MLDGSLWLGFGPAKALLREKSLANMKGSFSNSDGAQHMAEHPNVAVSNHPKTTNCSTTYRKACSTTKVGDQWAGLYVMGVSRKMLLYKFATVTFLIGNVFYYF